jgi:hypothetical protein
VSGTGEAPVTWSGHPQGHGGTLAVGTPRPLTTPVDLTEVAQEAFTASPQIFASWLQALGPQSLEAGRQPVVGPSSSAPLAQEVIENLGFVPTWASAKKTPTPGVEPPHEKTKRASSQITPAWARKGAGGLTAPHGPPPRDGGTHDGPTGEKPINGFRPAWVLNRQAGHRRGTARGTERGGTNHPYERPAYGQSRLRPDQRLSAATLARRLANDRTPGRINASPEQLLDMATAVAEARADGINPRTGSKDAFALREFEAYAQIAGFDPNLQTEWARRFPERENLKLASWLLWRALLCLDVLRP